MPFSIERNDLARVKADVLVVPANEGLQINGGTGLALARAAGFERMQAACDALGGCPTGSAVSTPAFDLDARFVVHAVGPVWQGGTFGECDMLRHTYDAALARAAELGARSIALPLISAHTFGFPAAVSFSIALDAIRDFLEYHDAEVRLVLYGSDAYAVGVDRFGEIASYIDDRYVAAHETVSTNYPRASYENEAPIQAPPLPQPDRTESFPPVAFGGASYAAPAQAAPSPHTVSGSVQPDDKPRKRKRGIIERITGAFETARESAAVDESPADGFALPSASAPSDALPPDDAVSSAMYMPLAQPQPDDLASWLDQIDDSFSTTLLALIDLRGLTDAQVYKRANMSRQLFSKIRSDEGYRPTKKTVLALAIALKLNLQETSDLLKRAGFALSSSSKADIIVEYFIVNGNYDIFAINEALYAFDQPLL